MQIAAEAGGIIGEIMARPKTEGAMGTLPNGIISAEKRYQTVSFWYHFGEMVLFFSGVSPLYPGHLRYAMLDFWAKNARMLPK